MGEVIEIENLVTMTNVRKVHLLSNDELTEADLRCYLPGDGARIEVTREAGVWHLRAEWRHSGLLDLLAEGWVEPLRVVVKTVQQGDRISAAIHEAAKEFVRLFGRCPERAYMRKLPRGVEVGQVVMFYGQEMILLEPEWMPTGCVAVGWPGEAVAGVSD